MNKIIVIAPHADDEVLGCGATMAKFAAQGDNVIVIIATNAAKGAPELYSEKGTINVRAEAKAAHSILGVKKTIFMDFPAPALNAYPSYKISLEFLKVFDELNPTHLFLPHPFDLHEDHKSIYHSALVAARPQGSLKIPCIYCYETLSETEWGPTQYKNTFCPNYFVNVADFYTQKIESMKCYKSQLKEKPHSRSIEGLTALANFRGATIGVEKAEAFSIERLIDFD